MAKVEHYYTKFEAGNFYHIYNRTVDKKPMFKNDGNYEFFLKKYDEYLSAIVDTYAYCLLGNHFHMLIRIKGSTTFETIKDSTKDSKDSTTFKKLSNLNNPKTTHDIVSHQFRKFFQSYAMAFNKQHDRVGTLFQTPFKRAHLDSDAYFTGLIYYIHANPQNHDLIADFRDWRWSSYNRILTLKPSKLKKQEVIEWFHDRISYEKYHDGVHKNLSSNDFNLDDDTV